MLVLFFLLNQKSQEVVYITWSVLCYCCQKSETIEILKNWILTISISNLFQLNIGFGNNATELLGNIISNDYKARRKRSISVCCMCSSKIFILFRLTVLIKNFPSSGYKTWHVGTSQGDILLHSTCHSQCLS